MSDECNCACCGKLISHPYHGQIYCNRKCSMKMRLKIKSLTPISMTVDEDFDKINIDELEF